MQVVFNRTTIIHEALHLREVYQRLLEHQCTSNLKRDHRKPSSQTTPKPSSAMHRHIKGYRDANRVNCCTWLNSTTKNMLVLYIFLCSQACQKTVRVNYDKTGVIPWRHVPPMGRAKASPKKKKTPRPARHHRYFSPPRKISTTIYAWLLLRTRPLPPPCLELIVTDSSLLPSVRGEPREAPPPAAATGESS